MTGLQTGRPAEVRNKQGNEYQGGTLYSLCAGVQWQARAGRRSLADQGQITEVDIFKDGSFASFRSVLDSVLKDLHKQGIGTTTKRADCISEDTVGEAMGGECTWR